MWIPDAEALRVAVLGVFALGLSLGGCHGEPGPGEVRWVRLHDGEASTVDRALSVEPYLDGVVVAGWTSAPGPDGDVARLWLGGYDASGSSTFSVAVKGSDTRGLFASDVAVLSDGSLAVVGGIDQGDLNWDVWISVFHPNLESSWSKTFDGAGLEDQAVAVAVASDDTIAVGGYMSMSASDVDGFIWTFDRAGKLIDTTQHAGPGLGADVVTELAFFDDDDLIAVGYMTSDVSSDETDVWLLRRTLTGAVRFEDMVARRGIDRAQAVAVLPEGEFVLGGFQCEPGRALDAFVSRHDADGTTQWEVLADGPGGFADATNDLAVGEDGAIFVAGYEFVRDAGFEAVVRRYESDKTLSWTYVRAGPAAADDVAAAVAVDGAGRLFAVGAQTQSIVDDVRDLDAWVARLEP